MTIVELEAADAPPSSSSEKVIDATLAAKLQLYASGTMWWELIPRPFLCVIFFCFVFALISLVGVAIFAQHTSTTETATPSGLLLFIGIVSSIVGSLQTASGYCCQRLAHQLEELADHTNARSQSNPLVFIGLLLLACGTIAAVVNLGILGQSVTAPFAAMTLIFNGILACTVLHEGATKYDVLATILVLAGVGVAMLGVGMADFVAQSFVLRDLERIFFRSWLPILYSLCVFGLLIGSYSYVIRHRLMTHSIGLCCFAIGAGVLSGFSSLCVKCTVEIAKGVAQDRSNDMANPITYLFVLGIPCCVLAQLKLMSMGLQYFGTLKFVPPYHALIILSNLVNGMVYFDESKAYNIVSALLFVVGCGVTIAGVLLLLAKVPSPSTAVPNASINTNKTPKRSVVVPEQELTTMDV